MDFPGWLVWAVAIFFVVPPVMGSELLAYWPFDEGSGSVAADASGNGFTGTVKNAVWTSGIKGSALLFRGTGADFESLSTGSHVATPFRFRNVTDQTQFSITAWFRTTSSFPQGILEHYVGSSGDTLTTRVTQAGGPLIFNFRSPSLQRNTLEINPIIVTNDGNWHYIVFLRRPTSELGVYIDGVVQPKTVLYDDVLSPHDQSADLFIGAENTVYYQSLGHVFNGTIDEVKVYDYALSDGEISGEYAALAPPSCTNECSSSGAAACSGVGYRMCGNYDSDACLEWSGVTACTSGKTCQNGQCVIQRRLLAHWAFDEGFGSTARDVTGNGFDGTVYRATWTGGVSGTALQFYGNGTPSEEFSKGSYVSTPFRLTDINDSTEFSLSLWFKTPSPYSAYPVGYYTGNGDLFNPVIQPADSYLFFNLRSPDSKRNTAGATVGLTLDDSNWHHLAITRNTSSNMKMYLDGAELQAAVLYDDILPSFSQQANWFLGGWNDIYHNKLQFVLNGSLDEIKVYNYALSDGEISGEYTALAPPSCTNECSSSGAAACSGVGYRICGNYDGDACLDWSSVTACVAGEQCIDGVCIAPPVTPPPPPVPAPNVTCTDDCVSGVLACSGGGVMFCDNFDDDTCLEWSVPAPCSEGQVCDAGICVTPEIPPCADECPAVVRACWREGLRGCANFDDDPCLEWSSVTRCPTGMRCSAGACAPLPPPEERCVTICHYPEQIPPQTGRGDYEQLGNPQTICVAPDALQAHHDHNDYLGECILPDEKERDREIRNIIERLEARRPKEIPILRPDMPIEKVTIEVDEEFTRVEIVFRNTERPPEGTPEPTRKVRRYIEIDHPDIGNERVTSAKLDFKVERSWLREQGASLEDVVLTRFKDGAWQDLPTRNVRSDANYEYFEADSAGLSVFAITVRAQEPSPAEPIQEIPVQPPLSLLPFMSQTSLIGIAVFVLAGGALGAMLLSRMQRRAPKKAAGAARSPALAQYVQSCRAKGFSDEKIRQTLLKTGWNPPQVSAAMRK